MKSPKDRHDVAGHRAPTSARHRRSLVRRASRSSSAAAQQLEDGKKSQPDTSGWDLFGEVTSY